MNHTNQFFVFFQKDPIFDFLQNFLIFEKKKFYGIWGFFLKINGYSSAKNRENTLQLCRQKIWGNQITQKESIEFSDEISTLKYNHNNIYTNSYNIIIINNKFCKPTKNNTLEIIGDLSQISFRSRSNSYIQTDSSITPKRFYTNFIWPKLHRL